MQSVANVYIIFENCSLVLEKDFTMCYIWSFTSFKLLGKYEQPYIYH